MRNLKRLLVALFVLLLVTVVMFFVLENQATVPLVLFGWSAPAIPVSVWILAALVIGLAVGPLLGAYGLLRARRRIRSKAREATLSNS